MAAVKELLRAETDGTLSFGDYTLDSKTKLDGFEFQGDTTSHAYIGIPCTKECLYTNPYRELQ